MPLKIALYVAALLVVATGMAHSYFGERYLLMRLFRRNDLPKLFGSTDFTVRTLRFLPGMSRPWPGWDSPRSWSHSRIRRYRRPHLV